MTTPNRNIWILSFTLLVVMLGYGMVLPVMPFYITELGAGGSELGWLMSTYSLMQLICAPLWGILSDRVGRKPVLALGVFGYALTLTLFGLATQFWMLFLARSLSGILSSATMPTAMAYIGDNAPQKERSAGMGRLGAAMGSGVILGPLLGGWLSQDSLSLPFFIGAGMALVSFILVLIFLPESRLAAKPETAEQAASPLKAFFDRQAAWTILRSPAGMLLVLIFILSFGLANFQGMIGLYVIDRFTFSTDQVGVLWMVMGVVMVVAQGGLTGPLTKKLGEWALIRLGLLGGAAGFGLILLSRGYVSMLLAVGWMILTLALLGPALNAYISAFAGERQGLVMGLNSAAASLGRVVGPLWGGWLYDLNLAYPFASGGLTLLVGFAFTFIGSVRLSLPEKSISQ